MSSIKLKHSGGNGVSIAPPDTNPASDKTVKLPAANGTLLTTESSPSFRNLVVNGAFQVAQRGTSSTASGFGSVDRWKCTTNGTDEAVTHTQHVLTSSDTGPWAKGFRYSLHAQNGNQTSGAGAGDYAFLRYALEAQDIANSGWEYTSSSSYITFSFWVRSSVAQNFNGHIQSHDGTAQNYPFETGSLSANTWTKITKTIPGNSNLQFDNDSNVGFSIRIAMFYGTDRTGSVSNNTWAAYDSDTRVPDMTSTWWTTDDATFEITGVQLEVGEAATEFEHRSYGEELERCKRYCQVLSAGGAYTRFSLGYAPGSTDVRWLNDLRPEMRATPTFAHSGSFACQPGSSFAIGDVSLESSASSPQMAILNTSGNSGHSAGEAVSLHANNDANAKITFDSEI